MSYVHVDVVRVRAQAKRLGRGRRGGGTGFRPAGCMENFLGGQVWWAGGRSLAAAVRHVHPPTTPTWSTLPQCDTAKHAPRNLMRRFLIPHLQCIAKFGRNLWSAPGSRRVLKSAAAPCAVRIRIYVRRKEQRQDTISPTTRA